MKQSVELGPPGTGSGFIRRYDIAVEKGIQQITIYVTLLTNNGDYLDDFKIDAKLSLLPLISKIEPSSVAPGEKVTIYGFCFSDKKPKKGSVIFNGKILEIDSWSDRKILVKVPNNTSPISGKLRVLTGENYTYESNEVSLTVTVPQTTIAIPQKTYERKYNGFDESNYALYFNFTRQNVLWKGK